MRAAARPILQTALIAKTTKRVRCALAATSNRPEVCSIAISRPAGARYLSSTAADANFAPSSGTSTTGATNQTPQLIRKPSDSMPASTRSEPLGRRRSAGIERLSRGEAAWPASGTGTVAVSKNLMAEA